MKTEILVVREKDEFTRILIEQNFSVVNLPLIKTAPLADLSELENCLENLDAFDGIFMTSSKAAEVFLEKAKGKSFVGKFYVLGRRSEELLKAANCKTFSGDEARTAAQLLRLIPAEELKGKNFLFLRGNRSLRVVPETLEKVAKIREIVVYRTIAVEVEAEKLIEIKEKLARGKIGAICFFSPSGAEEFLKRFENFSQAEIKIAAIGETTARFVKAMDLRVDYVALKPSAKNFAADFIEYLRNEH